MDLVLVTGGAILPPLHPLGMLPFVLIPEVVPIFAIGAFEDDLIAWHCSFPVVSRES
jgi:hypothetical protein